MAKKDYSVKQHKSGLQYIYSDSEIYGVDDKCYKLMIMVKYGLIW